VLVCGALQDTPGYGDDLDIMNHINMINGHINACNDKWLTLESARDRTQDLTEVRCCHRVPDATWSLHRHCSMLSCKRDPSRLRL
jgi:hypothetical protein